MFRVNDEMVNVFNKTQKLSAEYMYLSLAYAYENEESLSGSQQMSVSTEKKAMNHLSGGYSFAERLLISSYKELYVLSKEIKDEHGTPLIGFVSVSEKTPENALLAWRIIYKALNRNKENLSVAK